MTPSLFKKLDSAFGPLFCALLSRPQGEFVDVPLEDRMKSILVIRPGGIGDAVMLLPSLLALREKWPLAQIDILCESRNSEVFRMALPGATTMVYDRHPFSAVRRIRKANYTAVIDTEQFHHFSGVLTALTRAKMRIGFKINTHRNALYTNPVSYDLDGLEDAQFARLFDVLSDGMLPRKEKFGAIAGIGLPALRENKALAQFSAGREFAVIHVGGSVSAKRWPEGNYTALANLLKGRFGLDSAIVGLKCDARIGENVARECGGHCASLCGRLSLQETAALCARAKVFVGSDSGIAHLANALGRKCVVLFGPSDPKKWGPKDGGVSLRFPVPCGPCAIFGYNKPCNSFKCIKGITPEMVADAAGEQLS